MVGCYCLMEPNEQLRTILEVFLLPQSGLKKQTHSCDYIRNLVSWFVLFVSNFSFLELPTLSQAFCTIYSLSPFKKILQFQSSRLCNTPCYMLSLVVIFELSQYNFFFIQFVNQFYEIIMVRFRALIRIF